MSYTALTRLIKANDGCQDSLDWLKDNKYNLLSAYNNCERADWLLWLLGKMADQDGWLTRKQVVLLACDLAESVLHYVAEGEDRPRKAIEITRRWAEGDESVSLAELRDAAYAAYAAYDAYADAYAAANAANAAAAANAANAAANAAAYAAAYAAYAAASAAAYAAASAAAYAAKHKEMCDLIRSRIAEWGYTIE